MEKSISANAETGEPTKMKRSLTVSREELLRNGSDAAFRDLLHDFFAFASRMDAVRTKFGNFIGLPAWQYMILITIARMSEEEEGGINQIAEHLHLSGAFVTIEVNKLAKANYVVKKPHPTDGRRVILSITSEGRQQLEKLAQFQRPVNDVLFGSLSSDQFADLCKMMRQLAADCDQALNLATFLAKKAK